MRSAVTAKAPRSHLWSLARDAVLQQAQQRLQRLVVLGAKFARAAGRNQLVVHTSGSLLRGSQRLPALVRLRMARSQQARGARQRRAWCAARLFDARREVRRRQVERRRVAADAFLSAAAAGAERAESARAVLPHSRALTKARSSPGCAPRQTAARCASCASAAPLSAPARRNVVGTLLLAWRAIRSWRPGRCAARDLSDSCTAGT